MSAFSECEALEEHRYSVVENNAAFDGFKAALDFVLSQFPNNDKATFANQGQGMDGYTELATYKQAHENIKKELEKL